MGLQIVGRRFADEQVISLSRRIEQVRPWIAALDAVVGAVSTTIELPLINKVICQS